VQKRVFFSFYFLRTCRGRTGRRIEAGKERGGRRTRDSTACVHVSGDLPRLVRLLFRSSHSITLLGARQLDLHVFNLYYGTSTMNPKWSSMHANATSGHCASF